MVLDWKTARPQIAIFDKEKIKEKKETQECFSAQKKKKKTKKNWDGGTQTCLVLDLKSKEKRRGKTHTYIRCFFFNSVFFFFCFIISYILKSFLYN